MDAVALIEKYPLRVYYPYGGKRYLLHWYTYKDRGHLILAHTREQVLQIATRVFADNPDAEIKDYLSIEVVAPSQRMLALYAKAAYEDEVDIFWQSLSCRLAQYLEHTGELPSPFGVCRNYCSEDTTEAEDTPHYACRNCTNRIILPSDWTKERVHSVYAARLEAADAKKRKVVNRFATHRQTSPVPNLAARVSDDERLWCALADHDHHAKGSYLTEAEYDEDYRHSAFLFRPVLFFYRRMAEEDRTPIEALLEAANRVTKEKKAEKERFFRQERQAEERAEVELIRSLLRGDPC